MPKQIQYIKDGVVVAQLDAENTISIPEHDTTNEVCNIKALTLRVEMVRRAMADVYFGSFFIFQLSCKWL